MRAFKSNGQLAQEINRRSVKRSPTLIYPSYKQNAFAVIVP
jgi:hypothetical protein